MACRTSTSSSVASSSLAISSRMRALVSSMSSFETASRVLVRMRSMTVGLATVPPAHSSCSDATRDGSSMASRAPTQPPRDSPTMWAFSIPQASR